MDGPGLSSAVPRVEMTRHRMPIGGARDMIKSKGISGMLYRSLRWSLFLNLKKVSFATKVPFGIQMMGWPTPLMIGSSVLLKAV